MRQIPLLNPAPTCGTIFERRKDSLIARAAESFQKLVLSVSNQLRGGGGPGQFFAILEKELIETARVWKETRRAAGKDTAIVDRRLASELDRFPKVSITQVRTKPGENVDFFRGEQRVGGIANPPLPTVVPEGGTLAEARTGRVLTRGQPTPRKADTQIAQARDKDGNIVNVLVSKVTGKVINEFGRGPETSFVDPRAPGVGRKELADLDEAEIGATNAIQGAFKLREAVLAGGPEVLGAPGVLSGLVQGFVSQTLGFAQLAGVNIGIFDSGASADTAGARAEGIFAKIDEAGTINAEIRSSIVNLAFAAAAASGQTGRGVSDRDYERFVRELGAGASNPKVFASVLTKFAKRLNDNFATRFKVKMRRVPGRGKEPAPDLFNEVFGALETSAAPTAGGQSRNASSLPENTTATNPDTGEKLIVRGGKWVKQ